MPEKYTNAQKIAFRKNLPSKYWGSGIIIPDSSGKYLLVKDHKGRWNTVGGVGDQGESILQTAYREMEEEIGLRITIIKLLIVDDKSVMIDNYLDQSWQTIWLAEKMTENQKQMIVIDGKEIVDYGFFTWKQVLDVTPPTVGARLKNINTEKWEFLYLENQKQIL